MASRGFGLATRGRWVNQPRARWSIQPRPNPPVVVVNSGAPQRNGNGNGNGNNGNGKNKVGENGNGKKKTKKEVADVYTVLYNFFGARCDDKVFLALLLICAIVVYVLVMFESTIGKLRSFYKLSDSGQRFFMANAQRLVGLTVFIPVLYLTKPKVRNMCVVFVLLFLVVVRDLATYEYAMLSAAYMMVLVRHAGVKTVAWIAAAVVLVFVFFEKEDFVSIMDMKDLLGVVLKNPNKDCSVVRSDGQLSVVGKNCSAT